MIEYIELRSFRNHKHQKFNLSNKVFIEGPNGTGKTSLLEAIYYVSLLKSHRTSDDLSLIMHDKTYAKVVVKTHLHSYEVVVGQEGKSLSIDKVNIKKMSQFIGGYKVVMFSPEDLDLIKGMPRVRRSFLDIEMFQINPSHMDVLSDYKNVLNQRNALLKRLNLNDDLTFLKIITKRLAYEADLIVKERDAFIKNLNKAFKKQFKHLNKEDEVEVIYQPNSPLNTLEDTLLSRIDKDILSKTTNAGPHRDDFLILFNKEPAKEYASQGQQRLMAIALKMAIVDLIKGGEVIILLDDILSELDYEKAQSIQNLFHLGSQVIITGTENVFNIETIHLKEGNENGK